MGQMPLNGRASLIPATHPSTSDPDTGTQRYLGFKEDKSAISFSSPRGTGLTGTGYFFTDDPRPFTDNQPTYRSAPNISTSVVQASPVIEDCHLKCKCTYMITNDGSESVTITKFCVAQSLGAATSEGQISLTLNPCTVLCFVHEFVTPIVIEPAGVAAVEITITD